MYRYEGKKNKNRRTRREPLVVRGHRKWTHADHVEMGAIMTAMIFREVLDEVSALIRD